MERNQNSGDRDNRGDEYTQQDEEKMDRVAQAGVEGAFGAAPGASETRERMRQDAEQAFSENQAEQGSAGTETS